MGDANQKDNVKRFRVSLERFLYVTIPTEKNYNYTIILVEFDTVYTRPTKTC
jgi:hypothetical protein